MLIQIANIDKLIQQLPRDKVDALIRFNSFLAGKTIEDKQNTSATEIEKNKSYLLYLQEFIRQRGYEISFEEEFMEWDDAALKKLSEQLSRRIGAYIRPRLQARTVSEIRSSMATALAAPDAYIEGIILDQPTKSQIRKYVEKVKETVENSDLTSGKKEALLTILNEFLAELDKEKTNLERWAEFYVVMKRDGAAGTKWALDTAERAAKIWSTLTKGRQSLPAPERDGELEAPQGKLPAPDDEAEEDAAD